MGGGALLHTSSSRFGVWLRRQAHCTPRFGPNPGQIDRQTRPVEGAEGQNENCRCLALNLPDVAQGRPQLATASIGLSGPLSIGDREGGRPAHAGWRGTVLLGKTSLHRR